MTVRDFLRAQWLHEMATEHRPTCVYVHPDTIAAFLVTYPGILPAPPKPCRAFDVLWIPDPTQPPDGLRFA